MFTDRKGDRRGSRPVYERYSDALAQVSWQDFEKLMVAYYAGQGYRVEHVGTAGSGTRFDGGIDLKLYLDGQYLVVQCKHWNAQQVTHNPVHELLGVMLTEHATGAIVVTSGEFTRAAHAAATREPRIQLIDGAALRQMVGPLVAAFVPNQADDASFSDASVYERVPTSPASYRPRRGRRAPARNPLPGIAFAIIASLIAFFVVRNALTEFARKPFLPTTTLVTPHPPVRNSRPPALVPRQTPQPMYGQDVPTTDAEMREWKRKNAESMRIIEKSTPELLR